MAGGSIERLGGPGRLNLGARATRAKRSLAEFVRQAIAAGVVEGIKRVEWGPHLDALCSQTQLQLEAWLVAYGLGTADMVARQRAAWERTGAMWEDRAPRPWERYVLVQNEIDNLPPGTLKSTVVMICANAWIWLWCPWFAFAASSGIDANVKRDSDACRELIKSAWYRETFSIAFIDEDVDPDLEEVDEETGITVRHDANAVSDWKTTMGGRRISRTIGRGLTGAHVDGIFLDDPDDADKVWNEPMRLRPQNRWTRAFENRTNDDHRSIRKVMQQVVHPEGMTAYLLARLRWSPATPKGWARLCIPAEYGYGPPDAPTETPYGWRDWRTVKGEVLHPRLSPGVLADYRIKMPGYEGQYNQNADQLKDGWFRRQFARFFLLDTDPPPARERPVGCPSRADASPIRVRLADLTRITLSVDAANSLAPDPTSKTTSAVGLQVVGHRGEERFVLDDRTRVLGPDATYWAIYELMATWPLERVLIELKAMGAPAVAAVRGTIRRGWYIGPDETQVLLRGPDGEPVRCVVDTYDPGKDSKAQRAYGMIPAWQQGLILFRDGAESLYPKHDGDRRTVDEGAIGEICSFPGSRRTERIDTLSQLFADARRRPEEAPTVFGGYIVGER